MNFTLFEIDYTPGEWFWVTLFALEYKDIHTSLIHIERNNGLWKFQFLFYPLNKCITK